MAIFMYVCYLWTNQFCAKKPHIIYARITDYNSIPSAHGKTADLSCHVQKFVSTISLQFPSNLKQNDGKLDKLERPFWEYPPQ